MPATRSTPADHAKQSSVPDNSEKQLQVCKSCHSYHYIEKCIYLLGWQEWLEYHHEYMPSEPFPEYVHSRNGKEAINLLKHARELDDKEFNYRHIEVHNTRLKAELMTPSGMAMIEDTQRKITDERDAARRVRRQAEFAKEVEAGAVVDEGSEDELA